jgi:hypothetical protein
MSEKYEHLWDAIAVDRKTSKVRIFGAGKTKNIAEVISKLATMRLGFDVEFYTETPAGKFKDGDIYKT